MSQHATKVETLTFGCRLNLVDSETLARDYSKTQSSIQQTVIVNTCAVTREAVRQSQKAIKRLHRERPDTKIIVAGCAARIDPSSFEKIDGVSHIIKQHAPEQARIASEGTRGLLAVQNGCDHDCTFCIIPQGRGASRSATPQDVLDQARRLLADGKKEIVLTGVDLTSYAHGSISLGKLVQLILRELPELPRLRLSSIDCIEADSDLMRCFAEEERLCPHLHLSLQSGDNLILKRMKRRHLREEAISFCAAIRSIRPDIVFGADLIVGFPTESEEMFSNSCSLVDACGITYLHVFPFSARPETPAARMPQTPHEVIKARAAHLRALGDRQRQRHLDGWIGKKLRLLTERGGTARASDFTLARTPHLPPGVFFEAEVVNHDGQALEITPLDRVVLQS